MDERIIVPERGKDTVVWRRLLREWIDLINRYSTFDDVPYWYGERALTGLLGAAAWILEHGWALQEFAEGGDSGLRRGGLWWGVGKAKFTVQAKIDWEARNAGAAIQRIRQRLANAEQELQSLEKNYRWGNPYSVCYVVPWPPVGAIQEGIAFLDLVTETFASEECIVAKYSLDSSAPKDGGRVYPGVALIAREGKWQK